MGIPVAISTDGSGSADNQNIIAAARLASQYQKALNQNARLLTAQEVLEMITCIPASMLGLNAGELEAGRDADFILVDTRAPNLTPTRLDNCVENLIWAANGNEIRYVVAAGEILVNDYQFTTLDASKIKRQVLALSERFTEYRNSAGEISHTGARASK
jgi:5-methylthioadenosine/S-adenosylhomocysteine deaminase